jgi:hypothetical protein
MKTYKDAVAEAVNDIAWQEFRRSLKGQPTKVKLQRLREYYLENGLVNLEVVRLRVHNYLTALARGGQIGIVGNGNYVTALVRSELHIRK